MKYTAWAVLSLGLLVAGPVALEGQEETSGDVELSQNYPNPFNSETTIPFRLGENWFTDGRRPLVSIRIYNVLAQLVAIPFLRGTGEVLDGRQLVWNGSGQFEAHWDGRYMGTNREAASGVYVYQLMVDGVRVVSRRMSVIR